MKGEEDESNWQKPKGSLASSSGRKKVGKDRLADGRDISVMSQSCQPWSICRAGDAAKNKTLTKRQ